MRKMRKMRKMMEDEMERQPEMGEMEVLIVRGKRKVKRREREDGSEKKKTGCRVTGPGREGKSGG